MHPGLILLNDMCLAKFAVNYEPVFENSSNTDNINDTNNNSDEENNVLQNRELPCHTFKK